MHVGVWQPHHGGRHKHHAISLQPNCMMLGWHAQHEVQGVLKPGCTSGPSLGTPVLQPHSNACPLAPVISLRLNAVVCSAMVYRVGEKLQGFRRRGKGVRIGG